MTTPTQALAFKQLCDSGILWLINRAVFHPHGLALSLHADGRGVAYGWSIVAAPVGVPWQYDPEDDVRWYRAAKATLDAAQDVRTGASGPSGVAVLVSPDGVRTPLARNDLAPVAPAPASTDTASGRADTVSPDTGRTVSGQGERRADVRAAIDAAFEIADTPADDACDHQCRCGHDHWDHSSRGWCKQCDDCQSSTGHYPSECWHQVDESPDPAPEVVHPDGAPQVTAVPELDRVDVEDLVGWLGTVLPADVQHLAISAWGKAWDRSETARAGLGAVRQVLAADGHPADEDADLGRAVADRIAHHRGRAATFAATLDEVLAHFTNDTHPSQKCKQTGHVPLARINQWRAVLTNGGDVADVAS
ncbi:hypothetical protein PV341_38120 [Streptomyces sp. PA03-1a]|nr:hypothetical protein [Streptomyces sp. PA03-1a]